VKATEEGFSEGDVGMKLKKRGHLHLLLSHQEEGKPFGLGTLHHLLFLLLSWAVHTVELYSPAL